MVPSRAFEKIEFTVYYGMIVHTPRIGDLEVIPNARIGVDSSGIITYVATGPLLTTIEGEARARDPSLQSINVVDITASGFRKFFIPGFIDTHIHAPQFPNCGVFGNSTLFSWLTKYTYPVEMALEDPIKAKDVYNRVVQKTLSNGTTFCAYYATIHTTATNILADCAFKHGQRAYIGRSCMDCAKKEYTDQHLEDGIHSTKTVIEHIKSIDANYELIKPILSPRNANKCSSEFMLWLAEQSREQGIPIQAHLSETEDEVEQILKMFPDCKTYAEIYDSHKLLTEKSILGHCIFLSNEELKLINERKSSISHCPTSNSCLTSGEARLRWIIDSGSKVGLGTDVSGGFSPSMLTTARHAVLVSRHVAMKTKSDHDKISVNESLYLATLGGAKVMGMEQELGSFEVGKKWECQLIDLDTKESPVDLFDFLNPSVEGLLAGDPLHISRFQDLIDKWVFNGDDRNVRRVYVNGRCVLDKDLVDRS
ncbi:hypothetical protein KL905_004629 [Ogataea polymorpha]|uniref:Probable guanine deaminase n=1 Tax=Ogataea polymorpha TaxID=460523 RepID=A0A9P8T3R3_9ASCO|nr:hypothetical protein KL907_002115 [Ogataea polymorpha]KAG7908642.1 hypothetical protein KL906_002873 [Ogataea polymorpha]KAG7916226.1 hypothetical protein KL905_004629 [Ogataea polymorpha]KAG7920765.1 hypothetical protein KL927_000009 [Ogataea polymorpha]KAG7930018.1 hypothetical protein KL925_000760 [Ogataea polymorpha]